MVEGLALEVPEKNPLDQRLLGPLTGRGQVSPLIERTLWSLEREEVAYSHQVLIPASLHHVVCLHTLPCTKPLRFGSLRCLLF